MSSGDQTQGQSGSEIIAATPPEILAAETRPTVMNDLMFADRLSDAAARAGLAVRGVARETSLALGDKAEFVRRGRLQDVVVTNGGPSYVVPRLGDPLTAHVVDSLVADVERVVGPQQGLRILGTVETGTELPSNVEVVSPSDWPVPNVELPKGRSRAD